MQVAQLLGGRAGRASLAPASTHLEPRGRAALAIVEAARVAARTRPPPLPDVREVDGWVYSSLPVAVARRRRILIERLRQLVPPPAS